jgi:hypothetical protein
VADENNKPVALTAANQKIKNLEWRPESTCFSSEAEDEGLEGFRRGASGSWHVPAGGALAIGKGLDGGRRRAQGSWHRGPGRKRSARA